VTQKPEPSQRGSDIQSVFLGISIQLDALLERTTQLEQAAQLTVDQAENLPRSVIMHLQSFDYLRQSLADLAQLTRTIPDYLDDNGLQNCALKEINATLSMSDSKQILDPKKRTERKLDNDQASDTLIF